MRAVMAVEPRSYRQAMGRALGALRPRLDLAVVEPGDLWEAVARIGPGVVFSDRPEGPPAAGVVCWVEYRPYERPQARVRLGGRWMELGEVALSDLLTIVDEAEELSRAAGGSGDTGASG